MNTSKKRLATILLGSFGFIALSVLAGVYVYSFEKPETAKAPLLVSEPRSSVDMAGTASDPAPRSPETSIISPNPGAATRPPRPVSTPPKVDDGYIPTQLAPPLPPTTKSTPTFSPDPSTQEAVRVSPAQAPDSAAQ